MAELRKYGAATQIDGIVLIGLGIMDYKANPTLAAGDVTISKDGGSFASIEGAGTFGDFVAVAPASGTSVQVKPDATAMTCKTLVIRFIDQTSPKEWEDQEVRVETYGHASAMHPFDLGTASTPQTGDSYAIVNGDHGLISVQDDIDTLLARIVGTLLAGNHTAQSGDGYGILNNGTYGNSALNTLLSTIAGYLDTEIGDIKAITDFLAGMLETDGAVKRFTANALEQAPTGGGATAAAIADAVWDELLASHNIKKSASDYLKKGGGGSTVTLFAGTATAGTPTSITLANTVPAVANLLNQNLIVITGGTGAGQTRRIITYTAGRVCNVDRAFVVTPDATSTYEVMAAAASVLADEGTVVGATANTIQLATTAPSGDGALDGAMVTITGGDGSGETKVLSNYVGGTRTADTDSAWSVTPTAASTYAVIPAAESAADTGGGTSAPTAEEVATAVRIELAAELANMDDQVSEVITAIGALPVPGEIADKVLGRNIAGGSDGGRTVTSALRAARNKVAIAGGTMSVYQEDDVTVDWTAVVATTPGNPISSVDPA